MKELSKSLQITLVAYYGHRKVLETFLNNINATSRISGYIAFQLGMHIERVQKSLASLERTPDVQAQILELEDLRDYFFTKLRQDGV